jgi:uncharacterized protein GlcG (DUF336 family)
MNTLPQIKNKRPSSLGQLAKLSLLGAAMVAVLAGCGGGSGSAGAESPIGGNNSIVRANSVSASTAALTEQDVNEILARAIKQAGDLGKPATIAIVDRVGNVLAVYQMTGAPADVAINGDKGALGGLDGATVTGGAPFAAIAKAITGAYLSSSGNAFSTRTASLIVQENFYPFENGQPSGPLFGVQFSSLPCSDLVLRAADGTAGPKRSPLGLSADPGGFPLYKDGLVVGGIGVFADGKYGLDRDPRTSDGDYTDETIAWAALGGFVAPDDIQANRISAGGPLFVYTDVRPDTAATDISLLASKGSLIAVPGYKAAAAVSAGVTFGKPESGYIPDPNNNFTDIGGYVLSRSNTAAFPVVSGQPRAAVSATPNGLTAAEVKEVLRHALQVANRARAQIRRPVGSAMEVTVSVVDDEGNVLGVARTPDAPVFGTDVSLQKARTATFFSRNDAATIIKNNDETLNYLFLPSIVTSTLSDYITRSNAFFGTNNAFANGIAFGARSIGNIARPFYPDGPASGDVGPLSKPFASWSPFNDGIQLDLVYNRIFGTIFDTNPTSTTNTGCTKINTASGKSHLANGSQIFPGGVPIYRGNTLIGGIGVSGDGVDQDDMVSFLGLSNASAARQAAGDTNPIAQAPAAIRASTLTPKGQSLRYVQCPFKPFNDSNANNVCEGL